MYKVLLVAMNPPVTLQFLDALRSILATFGFHCSGRPAHRSPWHQLKEQQAPVVSKKA